MKGIILIGMAGVGKTTIGRLLSEKLGFEFLDLDNYISEKEGKTLQEIIDNDGEQVLLEIEKMSMFEIDLNRKVVAPGGSIIYHPDLMKYLKQHSTLVHLDDSLEAIQSRLTNVSRRGIVGLKNKSLKQLYDERRPLYFEYADIIVNCRGKSEGQIIAEILNYLNRARENSADK
jgi:shikimate kinase